MLQATQSLLEAAGAEGELSLGLLLRIAAQEAKSSDASSPPSEPMLAMVVTLADEPTLALIRTGSRAAVLTGRGQPAAAAVELLTGELLRLAPDLDGVNGEQRCSEAVARACARVLNRTPQPGMRSIAHELRQLTPASQLPGQARLARQADLELVTLWGNAFIREAFDEREQARNLGAAAGLQRCQAADDLTLWVDPAGTPVSMAAINRRTPRSACVSWVYTPPEARGHGYASAVVAALTERELSRGAEWVSLFTNADNPVSNRIYRRLGYRPRCTFVAWEF